MKAKIISYFLFMLAISIASCGDDDKPITDPIPGGGGEPDVTVNSYIYKGKTVEAKSVICTDFFKGYYCVYMSPLMNLSTVEDFAASGREYITFMIPQSAINKEVSLMNSELGCTFYYMDENSSPILESYDEDTWENVSAANLSLNLTDENQDGNYDAKGKFNITFKDGKTFTGEIACTYTAPVPLSNEVAFGDEHIAIKSTYATVVRGNLIIYLCPTEGLTDSESIVDSDNFLSIGINPNKVGQVMDITTEESIYTLFNVLNWTSPDAPEKDIAIANETWEDYCTNGTIQVDALENNNIKFSFDITMLSGKSFKGAYDGPCTIDITEPSTTNIITVNDITQDIKASFYMKAGGLTFLYLTPAGITNFEDIFNVNSYFVSLAVPDEALDGTEININTSDNFSVMYSNNSDVDIWINQEEREGATGTYSIKSIGNADNEYEVTMDMHIGNYTITGNYSGKFMSDAPPVKENEYQLGVDGEKVSINSVIIDKKSDNDMCDIYLSNQSGLTSIEDIKAADPIIIRILKTALDGELQFFSQKEPMSIAYKGKAYDKTNVSNEELNGGSAAVALETDHATIEFKLFQIVEYGPADLIGYYDGEVTVIE